MAHECCVHNIMSGEYSLRNSNEIGLAATRRPDKTVDLRKSARQGFEDTEMQPYIFELVRNPLHLIAPVVTNVSISDDSWLVQEVSRRYVTVESVKKVAKNAFSPFFALYSSIKRCGICVWLDTSDETKR